MKNGSDENRRDPNWIRLEVVEIKKSSNFLKQIVRELIKAEERQEGLNLRS